MKLNEQQKKAVETINGPVAVYAGPGSGKTRVIVERIKNMICNHGIKPENILALTFTVKAAEEMKERLLKDGIDVENLAVGTFHSFSVNIISEYNEEKFNILDDSGMKNILEMIKRKLDKKIRTESFFNFLKEKETVLFSTSNNPMEELRKKLKTKEDFSEFEVLQFYEEYLKQYNCLDFPSMLGKLYKLLCDDNILSIFSQRFKYILVDEYQDTNELQYEITKKMSTHKNIFVVGDDDQSIYSFRGADYRNIINFKKDFPEAELIMLEQNYRSHKKIVEFNSEMIKKNKTRTNKNIFSELEFEVEPMKKISENEIIKEFNTIPSGENIAFLCRTNLGKTRCESFLKKHGVFVEEKKKLCLEPMKNVISFALEPTVTSLRRYNDITKDISDTRSLDSLSNCGEQNINKALKLIITPTKFKNKVEEMLEYANYLKVISGYNFSRLFINTIDNLSSEDKEKLLDILSQKLKENNKVLLPETIQLIYEENFEVSKIKIMTAHGSKGLEFDNVFIYTLRDFPHKNSIGDEFGVEEERRVLYVAMTRAKKRLFLVNSEYNFFDI